MKRTLFIMIVIVAMLAAPASTILAQDELTGDSWILEGDIPEEGIPNKWELGESDDESSIVPQGGWMFNESGVLSAARYEDAEANASAVWSAAGDVQSLLENRTAELILPENGYMMVVGAGFDVTCGDFSISLEPLEDHAWFLVLRGLHEGRGDRNLVCEFSNYTAGAVLVTMYAIPVEASAFFSEGYLYDNMENALNRKNCGSGGCDTAAVFAYDPNDRVYGSWTFDGEEFLLEDTNAVMPEE